MPDDHSKLVPLLPIPNRTVKQLRADDSAGSRVKVGHRQALTALKTPSRQLAGVLSLQIRKAHIRCLINPISDPLSPSFFLHQAMSHGLDPLRVYELIDI